MRLHAIVLSGDVLSSNFFDQVTGLPKPGFSVKLRVLDAETDTTYECQFSDGFAELEELKQLKRDNAPPDRFEDAVNRLRANLPPKMTTLDLDVLKIKGKSGFVTLV